MFGRIGSRRVPALMRRPSGVTGPRTVAAILGIKYVAGWDPTTVQSSGDETALTSWDDIGGTYDLSPPGSAPTHYTGEWGPRNRGHVYAVSATEGLESTAAGLADLPAGASVGAFSVVIFYRCLQTANRYIFTWGSSVGGTDGAFVGLRTRNPGHSLIFMPDGTTSNTLVEPITGADSDQTERGLIVSYEGAGGALRIDLWSPQGEPADGWTTAIDTTLAVNGAFTSLDTFTICGGDAGGSGLSGPSLWITEMHVADAALTAGEFSSLRSRLSSKHDDNVAHILTTRSSIVDSSTATFGTTDNPGGDGDNIMFPSICRLEHAGATSTYGMLFGDHNGSYIRLAYSNSLTSGWAVQAAGTDLTMATLAAARGDTLTGDPNDHLSSPHVWWDATAEKYYCVMHAGIVGITSHGSFAAESTDFESWTWLNSGAEIQSNTTGIYLRPIEVDGSWYAFGSPGAELYKSATGTSGYNRLANYVTIGAAVDAVDTMRHAGCVLRGDTLVVFYSNKGDYREHIKYSTIDVSGADSGWVMTAPQDLIWVYTEEDGALLHFTVGTGGEVDSPERQLRDPQVFVDSDGSSYLAYAQEGEDSIGILDLTSWLDTNFPLP